jgi:hypothetical protein
MDTRTYKPIDDGQFTTLLAAVKANGLAVNPSTEHAGTVAGYDVEAGYSYDSEQQTVIVTIIHHPPFFEGRIWKMIEDSLPYGTKQV